MQKIFQVVQKLLLPRHWRFPLLGLMLVVGVVADRSRPVHSNQFDPDPYTYRIVQPQPGLEILEIQPNYGDETESFAENTAPPALEEPNWSDIAPGQVNSPTLIAAISPNLQLSKPNPDLQGNHLPKGDGIFMYGQYPQAGKNGKGYIVFAKKQGRVSGAVYMPNSEYSCFRGSVDDAGAIAMTVQGYVGESGSLQLAANNSNVNLDLDINAPSPYAHSVALKDFYRLEQVSQVGQEVLQACQNPQSRRMD